MSIPVLIILFCFVVVLVLVILTLRHVLYRLDTLTDAIFRLQKHMPDNPVARLGRSFPTPEELRQAIDRSGTAHVSGPNVRAADPDRPA